MGDPQDRPDSEPDDASAPPAKKPPVQKKASAKKAPAKKVPAKRPEPAPPKIRARMTERPLGQRTETNGQLAAAKDTAAQAKSTVDSAENPVSPEASLPDARHSPVLLVVAVALSLLALLLIRQLRRR